MHCTMSLPLLNIQKNSDRSDFYVGLVDEICNEITLNNL
jgi:hypothetical protein